MSTEVTNGFKKKMKVQALDPGTKHWLFATIADMAKAKFLGLVIQGRMIAG